MICLLLLAACLAYACYDAGVYFSRFGEGIFDGFSRPIGRDFVNYWAAGMAVLDDSVLQVFNGRQFHVYQEQLLGHAFALHNWSYPPHMLLLVWPFGQLPYLWALAAWSFLWLGLYLWASVVGRHEEGPLLLIALLLAPATYENFASGQNGFLTGLLLIGGLRLLGTRPVLAGILFGLLTVKPQLGVLLPIALLAACRWRTFVSASITAAVMVGITVLWFGWESWRAYVDLVVPIQTRLMNEGHGVFLRMMPSAYMGLRLLEVEPAIRWAVQGFSAMVAAVGVAWAFARSQDADLTFAVLAVGTFLVSPYSFNYDMTTVSLAVALVALRGLRGGFLPGERLVLAATWVLPTAVGWLNPVLPIGSLILLACFAYLLVRVRLQPGVAPAPQPAF